MYSAENPHPGYTIDPNIRNPEGHTEYPKIVFPENMEHTPANFDNRIIVENPEEELQVCGDPDKYALADLNYKKIAVAAGKELTKKNAPQMMMRAKEFLAAQAAGKPLPMGKTKGWEK